MTSTEQLGTALQEELDRAKTNLKGVHETLQKFLGRDPTEPRPIRRRISAPGTRPADESSGRLFAEGRGELVGRPYPDSRGEPGGRPLPDGRGELRGRHFPEGRGEFGGRPFTDGRGDFGGRPFSDGRGRRRDRFDGDPPRGDEIGPPAKRRITEEANGRIGIKVIGPRLKRASVSDEEPEPRPSVPSHVIPGPRPAGAREPPDPADDGRSRQAALQERKSDKENIGRSRRMFGALLGTLQRFRRDEVKQKDKVEKRAEIERRLEDAARREKAQLRQQRSDMFAERKRKQQEVRLIELKMARVKEEEGWENHHKRLMNFIRTSGKGPNIFFLPKLPHPNSDALLVRTQKELAKSIEERRRKLQDDLALFDARLHRLQDPGAAAAAPDGGGDHYDDDQEDEDEDEESATAGVVSSVVVPRGAGAEQQTSQRQDDENPPEHEDGRPELEEDMEEDSRPKQRQDVGRRPKSEKGERSPDPEKEDNGGHSESEEHRDEPMEDDRAERMEEADGAETTEADGHRGQKEGSGGRRVGPEPARRRSARSPTPEPTAEGAVAAEPAAPGDEAQSTVGADEPAAAAAAVTADNAEPTDKGAFPAGAGDPPGSQSELAATVATDEAEAAPVAKKEPGAADKSSGRRDGRETSSLCCRPGVSATQLVTCRGC
ncbi:pinin-like [Pollicipes pollicipes]|uniref:pinin-like n=1 Tax=Pollicipes pollicipes TaxID=41117 RepID=UPI001884FC0B|nr:pinin-like [Pollicipes pollicipes]